MAKILLSNINQNIEPIKEIKTESITPELKSNFITTEENSQVEIVDIYAMFPKWDVVPPSSIINPRKRKLQ